MIFFIEGEKICFVFFVREWDLGCVFYDFEIGKCIIYKVRFFICRIYLFMVLKKLFGVEGEKFFEYRGERFWLYYDESCLGVNVEELEIMIMLEEIVEFGLEFEKELEEIDMDGLVEFFERL